MAKILFVDTGVPAIKITEKGNISTDAEVLDKLAAKGHALPVKVIEWRALSKLKSTYTDALQEALAGARSHIFQPRRNRDGTPVLRGPEPAEHPGKE
jgi:DNA polymerase I-like protein with 3'-5' exonuclease and polymerase domains